MSKITSNNIFKNEKYKNILKVLNAYTDGLEFKHLAYVLLGEKKLIDEKYISRNSISKIEEYLYKNKRKDYQLSGDVPKNLPRLAECLDRLKKLGFIQVIKDKKINKYRFTNLFKAISTAKKDFDIQSEFLKNISSLTETKRILMHVSKQMAVYMSPEYGGKYKNSEKVKKIIDKFQCEVTNLLRELEALSKESYELWREKDYCAWVDLKQFLTIVIHFPPINSEEFLFDTNELKKKTEE